jgi:hypothetical protein
MQELLASRQVSLLLSPLTGFSLFLFQPNESQGHS